MTGIFSNLGVDWLTTRLFALAGQPITYWRGEMSVEGLVALEGKPSEILTASENVTTVDRLKDWILRPGDLVLNDIETLPQPGDLIVRVRGSQTLSYRVIDISGIPCYEMDALRLSMRVHTRLVKTT